MITYTFRTDTNNNQGLRTVCRMSKLSIGLFNETPQFKKYIYIKIFIVYCYTKYMCNKIKDWSWHIFQHKCQHNLSGNVISWHVIYIWTMRCIQLCKWTNLKPFETRCILKLTFSLIYGLKIDLNLWSAPLVIPTSLNSWVLNRSDNFKPFIYPS